MLDEILSISIKEIAGNCSIGCTPSELWEYINGVQLTNGKTLRLNEYIKNYIHRLLLNQTCITLLPNPNYKETSTAQQQNQQSNQPVNENSKKQDQTQNNSDSSKEAPIPTIPIQKSSAINSDNEDEIIKTQPVNQPTTTKTNSKTLVNNDNDNLNNDINSDQDIVIIKNKISTSKTNLKKWTKDSIKNDSLQQVMNLNKNYWLEPSDAFIYVADKYNQIISLGVNEEDRLTAFQFKILEQVSKSRDKGCIVRDLTILFNVDSRNIFAPIKDLILKGIIVKEEVHSTLSTTHISTGRLFLPKYFKARKFNPVREEWIPKYWGKVAFCYFLDQEPSKSLPFSKIVQKTGLSSTTSKKLKKLLTYYGFISQQSSGSGKAIHLHLEKPLDNSFWEFIESEIEEIPEGESMSDEEGDEEEKKLPATPTKKKAGTATKTSKKKGQDSTTEDQNENEEEDSSSGRVSNLVMEKTTTLQVFDFIREAGKEGITLKEIEEKSGNLSGKHVRIIIKELIVSFGVKIIPDLNGKQLIYRIYADPKDYIKSSSTEDSNAVIPYFQDYNALIESNYQPELNQETTEDEAMQTSNYGSRTYPKTILFIQRKNIIYKIIQESIGLLSSLIVSKMRKNYNDPSFDLKSLVRILQNLIEEKKIVLIKIYTQLFNGTHKHLLFVYDSKYKITDPEVQESIESIKSIYCNNSSDTIIKHEDIDTEEFEEHDELNPTNIYSSGNNDDGDNINDPIVKPTRKLFNPISLKYGFVKGSIVRAKLLHIFLWNFANRHIIKQQQQQQQQQQTLSQKSSQKSSNDKQMVLNQKESLELKDKTQIFFNLFIKTLPVSDYLRIVSQNTPIKDLSIYVRQQTPIINLPNEIKNQLFSLRTFTKRMGNLFSILKELGLIDIIVYSNKLSDYCFLRHVQLKNDLGEVKHYDFAELENLQRFWTDLQFMSLLPREPHSKEPPEDYILNRMKYLKNIVLWGVPRIPLTPDLKNKLISHFEYLENGDKLEREDLKTIASHYHVSFTKLSLFYLRYIKKKFNTDGTGIVLRPRNRRNRKENEEEIDEDDYDEGDEDEFGAEGAYSGIFKQKRRIIAPRRNKQSEINKLASEKRLEFKIQIAPYRRFKWTALEDSQLLKKYTEVFRDFFDKLPEGVKNSANSEFYITPSGIPSMLNPLWDKLGEEIQKIGQLCYRRMRLLVKKYPSYKNFHKSNKTPDLPLSIKEFNSLFTIQYNKSENLELFEFSRFDKTDEAIMRDKLVYLISIPEEEYSYNYGVKVLGNNKILSRHVLESLYNDKILKSLKSRNANRSIAFCVQKIYFKNNSLNKEFFQENRVFMNNIKEIPIDKVEDDDLFQFDPLTSGGSVSSMLSLFSNHKVLPIVGVKDSGDKEKAPKSRDFSGGRRLDLMLNKIDVSYLIKEYIDYAYIENERKRAINPEVIVLNDPLEKEKKKFNKIFQLNDDEEIEEDKDQQDNNISSGKSKRQKVSTHKNSNASNKDNLYSSIIEKYNDQFLFEDFRKLALDKLIKMNSVYINEKSNNYIINLVLAIQEVFKVIHSSKTKGVKRITIINHFMNNNNNLEDANNILRNLIIEESSLKTLPEIDLHQFIYEKLPSLLLELKSIGLIETLFTFSEKKYIAKEFFQDSLLPLEYTLQLEYQQKLRYEQKYGVPEGQEPLPKKYEPSLNYRQKRLIKPWIEPNGSINRSNFNKVFNEFITNVYHYPGSTLETIAHRLQKYSPSLLKEVAIILQQLDYLTIMEYDYKPPSLFSPSEFITKPFNPLNDGCTQLIFNSTPKFFNLQSDFSVYLLTEDF